ncbi:hypothetical protein DB345_08750 [Spartobacteria bacterium LR76]|nr:hypothetical protein DB345_08750 [Spartobacteria bacterium LR76]
MPGGTSTTISPPEETSGLAPVDVPPEDVPPPIVAPPDDPVETAPLPDGAANPDEEIEGAAGGLDSEDGTTGADGTEDDDPALTAAWRRLETNALNADGEIGEAP